MLSDNIKNLRKQKGYTQETLAQALNIVRQTVSKWEKGYSVPDADMLEKLSEVLEVPVSDLLGKPSEAAEQASELEKISAQLAILNEQMAREMARRKRNRKIKIIIASVIFGLLFIFVASILITHPVSSTLNTIYYAGDEVCADETRERGVKTIVLMSDFTTGNYDFGSLNSNYTYTNWSWILIENEHGRWEHIDHGYG